MSAVLRAVRAADAYTWGAVTFGALAVILGLGGPLLTADQSSGAAAPVAAVQGCRK